MTELLYLNNQDLMRVTTKVKAIDSDADGIFVILKETPFYPGGGGQEPDKGIISVRDKNYIVLKVKFIEGEVLHYLQEANGIGVNEQVDVAIDFENRMVNTRLHSAGHLISSIINEELALTLIPSKGFHYQEGSHVGFSGEMPHPALTIAQINLRFQELVSADLKLITTFSDINSEEYEHSFKVKNFIPPNDQPLRLVKIGDFLSYPCGGTHVKTTKELEKIIVSKIANKKGMIKVSYSLRDQST